MCRDMGEGQEECTTSIGRFTQKREKDAEKVEGMSLAVICDVPNLCCIKM